MRGKARCRDLMGDHKASRLDVMTIAGSGAPSVVAAATTTTTHSNGTGIEIGGHAVAVHHQDLGYEALYFLFLSLVLGAAARGAVRGSRLPYTVALLFLGLAIGFLHSYVDLGVLGSSLDVWVEIGRGGGGRHTPLNRERRAHE